MEKLKTKLAQNWRAGLTVSLVSIPLSISLSLAGGGTAQMGIITAIWAGLAASFLGGSNYNITGPTGALSGILMSFAIINGVSSLPILAIASGVLVLLVYLFRLEKYIILIPASVLHGFTLGVACIIGLGQFNAALGISPAVKHEMFIANLLESIKTVPSLDIGVVGITLIGLVFLLVLSRKMPKFPAVITLSIVGILLGFASTNHLIPMLLSTIQSRYGSIPNSIYMFPPHFSLSSLNMNLFSASVAVAVVAILETLISGKIADGMTHTRFNQRKEVFGLGVANVLSGFFGGLPATAALARTSLNVKSAATHKTSATINSLSVAAISIIFLPYFQYLPLSIVASILIYVAINMVKVEHFNKLYQFDKRSFYLAIFVALLTVVWEPIIAIGIGTVIALLLFINQIAQPNGEVNINDGNHKLLSRSHVLDLEEIDPDAKTVVYRFSGEFVYINAQSHRIAISQVHEGIKVVIFSLRNLYYIDMDGAETLAEIIDDLQSRGVTVAISGINQIIDPVLHKLEWFITLKQKGLIFDHTADALAKLK
jgi:SulP family sulfate permease